MRDDLGIRQFFSEEVEKISKEDKTVDQLLKRADPWCNSNGFMNVTKGAKLSVGSLTQLQEKLSNGRINHLVIFASEKPVALESLNKLQASLPADCFSVVVTPQLQASELFAQALAIPSISHYEKNGTIVNAKKMEQTIESDFRMFKSAWSVEEILKHLIEEYQRPTKEASRA